jgi:hypothetical protein
MSQQKKLEKVLDLLVNEDTDLAAELLHQIIVEKARTIYESIVDEEDENEEDVMEAEDDVVGGDPKEDFTKEIEVDKDEIDADELNDGEAEDDSEDDSEEDSDDEFGGVEGEGGDDERIEDLEDQLAQLRAEFDALMSQEMDEPEHAELPAEIDAIDSEFDGGDGMGEMMMNSMYESKTKKKEHHDKPKMSTKAEREKTGHEKHKGKLKVDEETQFTKAVGDTGQKSSNPGFAGTGKNTPKGAEQSKTPFTKAPPKPSYGGEPTEFGKGTGGEYGKFNAGSGEDDTPSDNVDEKLKKVAHTDNKDGWAGTGKESGSFGSQGKKAPLTKAPPKPM